MKRLEGKVAIVTGAASGIGAATARLFAREGAKVVATDVQEALLKQVVDGINAENANAGAAVAMTHDAADEAAWRGVVEETVRRFGKVDILVNNAGITGNMQPLEQYTVDEWNKVMSVNALSQFLGIKCVVPEMRKAGGGSIVNVSSIAGLNGMSKINAYGPSKGAVRILTKGAAVELAPDKIRVNSVHPGFVVTPMTAAYSEDPTIRAGVEASIPLQRMGQPEEIAWSILFLASDEASFITGEELVVDGGQTIRG